MTTLNLNVRRCQQSLQINHVDKHVISCQCGSSMLGNKPSQGPWLTGLIVSSQRQRAPTTCLDAIQPDDTYELTLWVTRRHHTCAAR